MSTSALEPSLQSDRGTARKSELDQDDLVHIESVFQEDVVPKLRRYHARNGVLGCDFAGRAYAGWMLLFTSAGKGFTITGFEYDENGAGIDLDL